MNYEQEQGREPEDISKNHDGSGFDIRSTHPLTGEIRRIEVKARASEGEFVELTPNEWLQAHRHGRKLLALCRLELCQGAISHHDPGSCTGISAGNPAASGD